MFKNLRDRVTGTLKRRDRLVRMVSRSELPSHVRDALLRPFTPDEMRSLNRIEEMRALCEADTREIVIVDYGAGSPDEHRTTEEMEKGVSKTQRIGEACRNASKPPVWGECLFRLVRHFRSQSCIEMGTCVGISGSYIAMALSLNGYGKPLVALEGSSSLAAVALANFVRVGLANVEILEGTFSSTLGPTLERMKPVDFIFIDGHHDEHATIGYFEQVKPFLAEHNVLVFDDIDWSDGMRAAWRKIADSVPGYALGDVGICLDAR
jgi:predicted O-methyltransferase YrrM